MHSTKVTYLFFLTIYMHKTVYCFNIEVVKIGIAKGDDGSQFGYSLGLIKTPASSKNNSSEKTFVSKTLLVGSPNKTLLNLTGHGQVSTCALLTTKDIKCNFLSVTDLTNRCDKLRKDNPNSTNCNTNGRLGATIAINRNFDRIIKETASTSIVSACAPGWKNPFTENTPSKWLNYPIGMCLTLKNDLSVIDCKETQCWPFWPDDQGTAKGGRPYYSHAQSGMSVAYTNDGLSDVIGGPGVDDWRGGISVNAENCRETNQDSNSTSYFGYSLTTGKFKVNNFNIAAGAPNYYFSPWAHNATISGVGHIGRVYIFGCNKEKWHVDYGKLYNCTGVVELFHYNKVKFHYNKANQTQMGTKFGASVAAIDVTGDGYDELFVGAPLYTGTKPEEGRVFAYTTVENAVCGPIWVLSGNDAEFGRFGTSIADAGDLNKDNYKDIAIGAPYEGSGVVYIYHGLGPSNGVMPNKFSQRIAGETIDVGIKSFGWSIYGNEDIDNNGYKDLVVGAYESDMAIVFRTRPIIHLDVTMSTLPRTIPLKVSQNSCFRNGSQLCFQLIVQFFWKTIGAKEGDFTNATLRLSVEADTIFKSKAGFSRVIFKDSDNDSLHKDIPLQSEQLTKNFSETYNVIIEGSGNGIRPSDTCTIIQFEGRLELIKMHTNTFEVLDPVLEQNTTTLIILEAVFNNTSDLQLHVVVFLRDDTENTEVKNNSEIYVGTNNSLQVTIDITSIMHASYHANFTSEVSALLREDINSSLGAVQSKCESKNVSSSTQIRCSSSNVLCENENVRVISVYDISRDVLIPENNIDAMVNNISIKIAASHSNLDVNYDNDNFTQVIDVKLKHEVLISENPGLSDQIRYTADENSIRTISITHQYYVTNYGPSFLPKTYVNITVPVKSAVETIANIKNYTSICKIPNYSSNVQSQSTPTTSQPIKAHDKREAKSLPQVQDGKSVDITCSAYSCDVIECEITNLERQETETIAVTLEVFERALAKAKNVREVRYATDATVTDPFIWYGAKVVRWDKTVSKKKWTKLIAEPTSSLNIWIIIGSVIGAVVLLAITVILLWKCGFFKRRHYDEVKKWKKQTLYKQISAAANKSY